MNTTIKSDGGSVVEVDSDDLKLCRTEIMDALSNGANYDEIADIMSGDLGLEMDYVMDVLGM